MPEPALLTHDRRSYDRRLDSLEARAATIEQKIDANTAVTMQVAEILSTFKVVGAVAKWVAAIAGGFAAVFAAAKGWTDVR